VRQFCHRVIPALSRRLNGSLTVREKGEQGCGKTSPRAMFTLLWAMAAAVGHRHPKPLLPFQAPSRAMAFKTKRTSARLRVFLALPMATDASTTDRAQPFHHIRPA
jgi:hypothetical protein